VSTTKPVLKAGDRVRKKGTKVDGELIEPDHNAFLDEDGWMVRVGEFGCFWFLTRNIELLDAGPAKEEQAKCAACGAHDGHHNWNHLGEQLLICDPCYREHENVKGIHERCEIIGAAIDKRRAADASLPAKTPDSRQWDSGKYNGLDAVTYAQLSNLDKRIAAARAEMSRPVTPRYPVEARVHCALPVTNGWRR
jgi:hypothetical protein